MTTFGKSRRNVWILEGLSASDEFRLLFFTNTPIILLSGVFSIFIISPKAAINGAGNITMRIRFIASKLSNPQGALSIM